MARITLMYYFDFYRLFNNHHYPVEIALERLNAHPTMLLTPEHKLLKPLFDRFGV